MRREVLLAVLFAALLLSADAGLSKEWKRLKKNVKNEAKKVGEKLENLTENIGNEVEKLGDKVEREVKRVVNQVENIPKKIATDAAEQVEEALGAGIGHLNDALERTNEKITAHVETTTQMLGASQAQEEQEREEQKIRFEKSQEQLQNVERSQWQSLLLGTVVLSVVTLTTAWLFRRGQDADLDPDNSPTQACRCANATLYQQYCNENGWHHWLNYARSTCWDPACAECRAENVPRHDGWVRFPLRQQELRRFRRELIPGSGDLRNEQQWRTAFHGTKATFVVPILLQGFRLSNSAVAAAAVLGYRGGNTVTNPHGNCTWISKYFKYASLYCAPEGMFGNAQQYFTVVVEAKVDVNALNAVAHPTLPVFHSNPPYPELAPNAEAEWGTSDIDRIVPYAIWVHTQPSGIGHCPDLLPLVQVTGPVRQLLSCFFSNELRALPGLDNLLRTPQAAQIVPLPSDPSQDTVASVRQLATTYDDAKLQLIGATDEQRSQWATAIAWLKDPSPQLQAELHSQGLLDTPSWFRQVTG